MAAGSRQRNAEPSRVTSPLLATFVLGYAAAWFLLNLFAMPPYIPGALMDPTIATPRAVGWLAIVSGAFVLPGSALACALAYRQRLRRHIMP